MAVSLVKGCMAGLGSVRRERDGVMTAERENFQPGAATAPVPTLYDYWSSSSAYRVRIALALKGIAYRRVVIRRLDGIEEPGLLRASIRKASCRRSRSPASPAGPVDARSWSIWRSAGPTRRCCPPAPEERARVRALAAMVVSDIQPLNNQRVQDALLAEFGLDEAALRRWYARWIAEGFAAIERLLRESPGTGRFCHGDAPTLADICLVPQVFNARRWSCDLEPYPLIRRHRCRLHASWSRSAPRRRSARATARSRRL